MTFPDFLSASYALLAEEHQRINPLKDLLSLSEQIAPSPTTKPLVRTTVAAQNDASLAQFTGMMKGVKKGR